MRKIKEKELIERLKDKEDIIQKNVKDLSNNSEGLKSLSNNLESFLNEYLDLSNKYIKAIKEGNPNLGYDLMSRIKRLPNKYELIKKEEELQKKMIVLKEAGDEITALNIKLNKLREIMNELRNTIQKLEQGSKVGAERERSSHLKMQALEEQNKELRYMVEKIKVENDTLIKQLKKKNNK